MGLEKIFKTFCTKIMSSEKFLVLKALFKTKREKNIKVPTKYDTHILNDEQINNQEVSAEIIFPEIKKEIYQNSQERENLLFVSQNLLSVSQNLLINSNLENDKVTIPSKFENMINDLEKQNMISCKNTSHKLCENNIYYINNMKLDFNNIILSHFEMLDQQIKVIIQKKINKILNYSNEDKCINNEILIQKVNNEKTYINFIFNDDVINQKMDNEDFLNNKNVPSSETLIKNFSNKNRTIYIENISDSGMFNKKLFYTKNSTLRNQVEYEKNIIDFKIKLNNFHIPIK